MNQNNQSCHRVGTWNREMEVNVHNNHSGAQSLLFLTNRVTSHSGGRECIHDNYSGDTEFSIHDNYSDTTEFIIHDNYSGDTVYYSRQL